MRLQANIKSGKIRTRRIPKGKASSFLAVISIVYWLCCLVFSNAYGQRDFSINQESLLTSIQKLQSFGTRFSGTTKSDSAAFYLAERMSALGLPTRLDTIRYLSGEWKRTFNVVSTLAGNGETEEQVVLGAHFDSISIRSYVDSLSPAPGADDNGSGCAALLALAEILRGYSFKKSIIFIFFGGEEVGRRGSSSYAQRAKDRGDSIAAMICLDAIGFDDDSLLDVQINYNSESQDLADKCAASYETSGSLVIAKTVLLPESIMSDHYSFWEQDYPAVHIYEGENDTNPYFHTEKDTAGAINLAFLAETVKAVALVSMELAEPLPHHSILTLRSGYPNPFSTNTTIGYDVYSKTHLSIEVFDAAGRYVRKLFDDDVLPGGKTIPWDGNTAEGKSLPSGVYFINFSTPWGNKALKVLLLR